MTGYFALIMSYSVLYDKIALLFVQNTLAGLVEYQVLPFGLSLAPRTFTKCMDAVLEPLSSIGIQVLNYLDDWLLCSPSREQAAKDTSLLLRHIRELGLVVNEKKSHLSPSQDVVFVGMAIDSSLMRASLPAKRVETILSFLARFCLGQTVSVRERLLGLLTAASSLVPLGLLHLRPLQRWFNAHKLHPRRHRHRRLLVTRSCVLALTRWRARSFLESGRTLGRVTRRELVCTDASLEGWGAVYRGMAASGRWSPLWSARYINVLELRAVRLALLHFLQYLEGRHVLVRSDNTTVVAYINNQGGLRSLHLHEMTRELLVWAHAHFPSRAAYVPGVQNSAADMLSRDGPREGDWRLHPQVVQLLWARCGRAQVDLFASQETAHCPSWFSLASPPGPLGLDALAHDWPVTWLCAFPPFPLIQATLDRVEMGGHRLLLIAPRWPRRPWFRMLLSLVAGTPWQLPQRPDLLSQAQGALWHPRPDRLQLWAWPLRGAGGRV